ncbi:MAG: hypothetical protein BWX45_00704 [Deltaproteobacteria bacterium ADurb.Bin002]|nr:MAG: hypothetical protein BWX45_00704 [Deltaproteobacteria bacterium ADurb.Bin002]
MMYYITEQLSEHIGETPEGFLLCRDVPLTRTGVFEYTASEVPVEASFDGTVKIQRDEDEVFAENTIASFEGKPVTINHPEGMVTPENWSELAHGVVQNVRRGDGEQADLLLGDILITTEKGIELVKSGLREVSCGYDAQYEQIEKGKGKQREIIGNHVALVTKGRAGSRCTIQDSGDKENAITTKEDIYKMKAKDLFKRIFPKSRFADALADEDLGEPAPVEGMDDVEKAQQAAAEAKASAEQAVEAAQQAAEAAKQASEAKEVEEPPAEEPPVEENIEDESPDLASIVERLDKLEALIQELIRIESEEGHEELPAGDAEGEEGKEKDLEEVQDDEGEEKEEGWEEEFNDVASNAEIIDPDIVVTPPKTKDAAPRQIKRIKMVALKSAMTSDSAPIVNKLLNGKQLEALKSSELDSVFFTASKMIAKVRDSKVQKSTVDAKSYFKSISSEIGEINKANKNFWKK